MRYQRGPAILLDPRESGADSSSCVHASMGSPSQALGPAAGLIRNLRPEAELP